MKAMLLEKCAPIESSPLRLTDLPEPAPGPGRVTIRVRACGLCHTDLHIVEAEIETHKLPLVIGHQIVGEIAEVGPGVTAWKTGDRVGVPWLNRACGQCAYCRCGRENLCEKGLFTGYDFDGGLAEFTVQDADWVYPIPPGFPDLQAAPLLCAGVIGYRALILSEVKSCQRLGLFGFGASAHVTIQVARFMGCEVFVFTRGEAHRDLSRQLGAEWTGTADDDPPALLDAAIIFAPAGELVPAALARTARGGVVVCAGIYMTPIPRLDYNALLYHERVLKSVANSTRQDVRELLDIAPRVPIATEVTAFPLQEANHALALLKQGKIKGAAVIEMG